VTQKSNKRPWSNPKGGSGSLFSVDLLDSGGEIKATFFNDAVDKWYDYLQVDQVYYISRGLLKPANKKYSTLKNDYELSLDSNSVNMLAEDNTDIPRQTFNFVTIDRISDYNKDMVIDVCGVVHETGECTTVKAKASNQEIQKRDISLVDLTQRSITLTLWGENATSPAWLNDTSGVPTVLAIKNAKVSDYNTKTIATVRSSTIQINPDIPETVRLQTWFAQNQGNINIVPLSSWDSRDPNSSNAVGSGERKTFAEIKSLSLASSNPKGEVYRVKGTVSIIRREGVLWYSSCPNCKKKLVPATGGTGFQCTGKCPGFQAHSVERYILNLCAIDHTGSQWMSAFDEVGVTLLGTSAENMAQLKINNLPAYEMAFTEGQLKTYDFKIRTKQEIYNDEQKIRISVVEANPINFVEASTNLLQLLGRVY